MVCCSVWILSGDPSFVQIAAYFSADFLGRKLRIIPFKISHQTNLGISTTLLSDKNSFRYFLRAVFVGASGVPRFTSNTPICDIAPCSYGGSLDRAIDSSL